MMLLYTTKGTHSVSSGSCDCAFKNKVIRPAKVSRTAFVNRGK